MLDLFRRHVVKTRSRSGLGAGAAVAVAIVFASKAPAQGPVLPLPASDQQQLAAHLGAGVVGAALPSERIADALAYFPLQEKVAIFQVTSGKNAGATQRLGLKKARRPGGAETWRFHFTPSQAGFINRTATGDLIMPALSDTDEGVVVVSTPANSFLLAGMQAGESRSFSQTVSVNYLDDPAKQDYGGRLNATYTYVGTYQVTVPAGSFNAILVRFVCTGKVGPADVVYTSWYLFARDTGMVAMVTMEDISAFWIFHLDTTSGKLLAVK